MKYAVLTILFVFICCKARDSVDISKYENFEPGKCYFSLLQKGNSHKQSDQFILEIQSPLFEEYESKITEYERQQFKDETKKYQIQTRERYFDFVFRNDNFPELIRGKDQLGCIVCYTQAPGKYIVITQEELLDSTTVITRYRIVRQPKLIKTKISKIPYNLTENQFHLKSGTWTNFRELVHPMD